MLGPIGVNPGGAQPLQPTGAARPQALPVTANEPRVDCQPLDAVPTLAQRNPAPEQASGPRVARGSGLESIAGDFIRGVMLVMHDKPVQASRIISLARLDEQYFAHPDYLLRRLSTDRLIDSVFHVRSELRQMLKAGAVDTEKAELSELRDLRAAMKSLCVDEEGMAAIDGLIARRWDELKRADYPVILRERVIEDENLADVAALCLEYADRHPLAVERLLFSNPSVVDEACALLQTVECFDASKQEALALCLLEAGHRLPADDLAPKVERLIRSREEAHDLYWEEKYRKHAGRDDDDGPSEFQRKGLPFFHRSNKYSRQNLNGKLSSPNDSRNVFLCRHLQLAAQGGKAFLWDMAKKNTEKLDYEALQRRSRQDSGLQLHGIPPESFGPLLTRLAMELRIGETGSLGIGWFSKRAEGDEREVVGHAMRIFIGKSDDGRIVPGLHEPNVTADVNHMKDFAEHVSERDFDDFDALHIRKDSNIDLLSLTVDLEVLGQPCGMAFLTGPLAVRPEHMSKLMRTAVVDKEDPVLADLVAKFLANLSRRHLPQDQLTTLLIAADAENEPWLVRALARGRTATVSQFLCGLAGLGLSAESIRRIAGVDDVGCLLPSFRECIKKVPADKRAVYLKSLAFLGIELDAGSTALLVSSRKGRS
jgi:hypothetical protein